MLNSMTNVVLLAGKGKRFADAGYTAPKPLISVCGVPMITRAVASMPDADKWVFVIRKDLEEHAVVETLKAVAPNTVVLTDPDPIGQLNSCLVAKALYDNDEPLFIGACDFGMQYDKDAYRKLIASENPDRPDIVAWSFTEQQNLVDRPQAWGWLKQDNSGMVSGVSVKVPISNDPFHDYAITGSFTFLSGKKFIALAEELMRRGTRVNGEFYVDSLLGLAIELGYRVQSFPVAYSGWGTPEDLRAYEITCNSQV